MWLFGCRTMLEIIAISAGAPTSAVGVVAGVPSRSASGPIESRLYASRDSAQTGIRSAIPRPRHTSSRQAATGAATRWQNYS